MTVDTPALTITVPRAADPAVVDHWHSIHTVARATDVPDFPAPCRHSLDIAWTVPFPGSKVERAIAYLGDSPVGAVQVDLPQLDNLDNADVELVVHPEYRRRGIGSALLEHALGVLKADGRKRFNSVSVESIDGGPERSVAGAAFATSKGMKNALAEVRRRLDMTTVDPALHARLLADAWGRAAGYSVVSWRNVTPDDCIEDVAALDSSFLEEAPLGDLDWEPEKFDAERVRKSDETSTQYGRRRYCTGVRHDASGRLVALSTMVMMYSHRHHAWQGITLVHPGHRGHRLGMIAKVENLRHALAHESELYVIDTWNADVNAHMIAINETMGFRAVDGWVNWQRDV